MTARTRDLPILRNPFCLLGVSPCDDRQRIVEAAEEKSLSLDGEICAKARSDLTHPRNRLAAELAWLPGIPPRWSGQFLDVLVQDPAGVFRADGLPALIRANLMASAILGLDAGLDESQWVSCVIALSRAVEEVSAANVLAAINEDRAAAGFAEVMGIAAVEEGLAERRREFRDCLRGALDTLPPRKLARVAAAAAETATQGGTVHPPALINDMIDVYAVGTHAFLVKEAGNVRLLIERACAAAPYGVAAVGQFLKRLEPVVRNWHSVAKPIQVVSCAKGTSHGLSKEVAGAMRGLGILLVNRYGMVEPAQRITRLIKETFERLPEIAELADVEARALDDFARRRAQLATPHRASAPVRAPAGARAKRAVIAVSAVVLIWVFIIAVIIAVGPRQTSVSSSLHYNPVVPFREPIRAPIRVR
jgi:hypothetical protein